jgi:hypothetical protein
VLDGRPVDIDGQLLRLGDSLSNCFAADVDIDLLEALERDFNRVRTPTPDTKVPIPPRDYAVR